MTRRPLAPEDFHDICTLKARYFRLLDTKDWDGWRQIFTDDLVVHGKGEAGARSTVFSTANAFVASVRAFVGDAITVHHGYTPELDLVDDGAAHGVWAMSDLIERPETERIYRGFEHYHEGYRRTPDGWRISEFELVRLREYRLRRDVLDEAAACAEAIAAHPVENLVETKALLTAARTTPLHLARERETAAHARWSGRPDPGP